MSNVNRDTYIVDQFLPPNYRTMQSIAVELGVSKQRIQQILSRNNIQSTQGGSIAKNARLQKQKQHNVTQKRKNNIQSQYQCSMEEAIALNGNFKLGEKGSPSYKYKSYKSNLTKKDIQCDLTFPQWCEIWEKSGKYHQMKPGKNGYSLVRKDASKPATVDNVAVVKSSDARKYGIQNSSR